MRLELLPASPSAVLTPRYDRARSPETIEFASPNHDDLATFRHQLKLRFDHVTFRDSADVAAPLDAAFKNVLGAAVIKYAGPGESDDDDEGLLPPSSIGTSGTKLGSQARAPAAVKRDGSSELSEDEEVKARARDDDDDEWLDGGREDAGCVHASLRSLRSTPSGADVA